MTEQSPDYIIHTQREREKDSINTCEKCLIQSQTQGPLPVWECSREFVGWKHHPDTITDDTKPSLT